MKPADFLERATLPLVSKRGGIDRSRQKKIVQLFSFLMAYLGKKLWSSEDSTSRPCKTMLLPFYSSVSCTAGTGIVFWMEIHYLGQFETPYKSHEMLQRRIFCSIQVGSRTPCAGLMVVLDQQKSLNHNFSELKVFAHSNYFSTFIFSVRLVHESSVNI